MSSHRFKDTIKIPFFPAEMDPSLIFVEDGLIHAGKIKSLRAHARGGLLMFVGSMQARRIF